VSANFDHGDLQKTSAASRSIANMRILAAASLCAVPPVHFAGCSLSRRECYWNRHLVNDLPNWSNCCERLNGIVQPHAQNAPYQFGPGRWAAAGVVDGRSH
jgi:hypothetical protein